jgi:hypothetical protein
MSNRRDYRRTCRLALRFSITRAAASIALGLTAPDARADMLDFEDLPLLQPSAGSGGAISPLTPNYSYHGFNLSAVHTWAPDVSNTWYYLRVLDSVQDPPYQPPQLGYLHAVQSGEYALGTAPHVHTNQSAFSFSRLDGGLFTFDGAWFTRIYSSLNQSLDVAMIGYVGDTVVYQDLQPIVVSARTFLAPPPGVAIDRLEFRTAYPGPNSIGGFYMDDFHYTLVPAPSVLAVLGGLGLFRKRAR